VKRQERDPRYDGPGDERLMARVGIDFSRDDIAALCRRHGIRLRAAPEEQAGSTQ
jgi:hypothetical protein